MNIEQTLIDKISKRISKLFEDEPAILHAQLKKGIALSPNVLSALKQGKIFQNNTTYLTKSSLETILDIFDITKEELLFGDELEIEEFVYQLYLKVAYNNLRIDEKIFDVNHFNHIAKKDFKRYEYMKFDEKIANISMEFLEVSFFSARLAYIWTLAEMENPNRKTYSPEFNFDISNIQQFDLVIDFLWEKNQERIIRSFNNDLASKKDLQFKDIENRIISWLKYDFMEVFKGFKEFELKADNIYNIGYQVRNLLTHTSEEISKKIKKLEGRKKIPEGFYNQEGYYEKMHRANSTQDYSFMSRPDFDTPQIKPYDTDLDEFSILLDLENIYIDHAILLMKYQDAHIRLEGNDKIDFNASPRVIRGK